MEKRERIIKAAQEVLAEKGLRESTVTEIARRSGVFDSEIYRCFKNKEDLLFHSLSDKLAKVIEDLTFQFSGIMGATNKLSKMIWFHLHINDFDSDSTRVLKNLLFECRSNKGFYSHEGYQALRGYTGIMSSILKEGVESSAFRTDFSVHVVRDIIFGLLDEEAINFLHGGETEKTIPDFESIMSLIFAMILNGSQHSASEDYIDKSARITEAAKRVFAEKGYDKATMVEVANEAKVAERTIYENFKSKEELLLSICERKFEEKKNYFEDMFESNTALTKLQRIIFRYSNLLLSDPQFAVIFLKDAKLNKRFSMKSYSYLSGCITTLYKVLDEGKSDGSFREDVNNRIFRNLFLGAFAHLMTRWVVLGKSTPIGVIEELNEASSLLCRAVTRKCDLQVL